MTKSFNGQRKESKRAHFLRRVIERNQQRREIALRDAELHAMKIQRAEQQLEQINQEKERE